MDVIRDSEYLLSAIERDDQVRARIQTRLVEASQKKKPGAFCPSDCMVDADDCENCLACQKLLEEYLVKTEKMEQSVNQPQTRAMPQKEKPTKCSLCGAPLSNGESECPYCGTAYGFLQEQDYDVPMSKDAFLDELNKITKSHVLYQDCYHAGRIQWIYGFICGIFKDGLPGFHAEQGFTASGTSFFRNRASGGSPKTSDVLCGIHEGIDEGNSSVL